MEKKATIKSYKGFDRDLKCRGYQYEVGKEYTMDGDISCCNRGFHACESPLEVLDYYFLDESGQMARFCEVEQSGKIDKESGNTKVCSSKIKIKAENELVAKSAGPISSAFLTRFAQLSSPGRSILVLSPKLNLCKYEVNVFAPSFAAINIKASLHEYAIVWYKLIVP